MLQTCEKACLTRVLFAYFRTAVHKRSATVREGVAGVVPCAAGMGTHKGCPYTRHHTTHPHVTWRSRWIPAFAGMTEWGVGFAWRGEPHTGSPPRVACRPLWIPVFTGMTEEGGE